MVSDAAAPNTERGSAVPAAPKQVRIAGALVGVQALAACAFVVALVIGGARGDAAAPGSVWAEVGFFVLLTAGVVAVAVGLLRGRHWSRTPGALLQVLLLGVAYFAMRSGRPGIAVPAAAFCVAVIVLLFVRASRQWAAERPLPGRGGSAHRG
jgi:predicted lipid-binding transport protein (Tim44 family)